MYITIFDTISTIAHICLQYYNYFYYNCVNIIMSTMLSCCLILLSSLALTVTSSHCPNVVGQSVLDNKGGLDVYLDSNDPELEPGIVIDLKVSCIIVL